MKKRKQVYLSWHSFNAGFVVAAKAIELLETKEKVKIDEIWYLQSQALSNQNILEKNAFLQDGERDKVKELDDRRKISTCRDIGKQLKKRPQFQNQILHIKGVTDYQSIYNQVIEFLKQNLKERPELELNINVSPGTPQMHVVWLMLNASGYLPNNTRLWSTQYEKKKNKTILKEIDFKPQTYLSQVLKSGYKKVLPVTINPNETLSNKRKEAERKIKLFSAIPNCPLLLLGERGIGKSTYVKSLILNQNPDLPSAEIACGTFSEALLRSELFGHKKGSFTGAISDKKGILDKFKRGGILFLDEIHDLPKPLQRQLMQVLQTGEFYPIGETTPSFAKFQLISASNQSINVLKNQTLDRDFFDRIARFIVEIPPLRESKEDIEKYWESCWNQLSNFENAPPLIWNKKIEKFLTNHNLFGNFRDLQQIISHIIAFVVGGYSKEESCNLAIKEFQLWDKESVEETDSNQTFFQRGLTHKEISIHFNRVLANWAKKEYGGLSEASKRLERAESTLYQDLRSGV